MFAIPILISVAWSRDKTLSVDVGTAGQSLIPVSDRDRDARPPASAPPRSEGSVLG